MPFFRKRSARLSSGHFLLTARFIVLLACLGLLAPLRAQFLQTGAGPYDYFTTANWNDGTINGVFSQTPTTTQSVTFGTNTTLATGLTFSLGGTTAATLTLRGTGADRTLTLGGSVTVNGTTTTSIILGSTNTGVKLNIDLGGADRTFSVASGSTLYVNNVVSGAAGLIKTGAGQLTLAGVDTYTGSTTINGGTLFLNNSGALVYGANVVVNQLTTAGTSRLTLGTGFTQAVGNITLGGASGAAGSVNNVTLNTGATLTLGGNITYNAAGSPGASTIGGGTLALTGNRTIAVGDSASGTDLAISSAISGSGYGLTKTGNGQVSFNGVSSFDGGLTINEGTARIGTTGALVSTSAIVINDTVGTGATFALGSGSSQAVGAVTLGGSGATSSSHNDILVGISSATTLTLGGTLTYNATNNPLGSSITGYTVALNGTRTFAVADSSNATTELSLSTALTGTGSSLIKTGAGTMAVSGDSSYTGGTTVSGGSLMVNNTTGSGLGSGAVEVQSGATLGGTGSISGATTLDSGAHLAPSSATLTFTGGLTLSDGAFLDFSLGTTSTKLLVSGATLTGATGAGSLTLNVTDAGGFQAGTYTLIDYSANSTALTNFDVGDFVIATSITGYSWSLGLASNQLQLTATPTAIPEPATCAAALAALTLAAAILQRRRVRRRIALL